jgi:signal transduction histidine kinase
LKPSLFTHLRISLALWYAGVFTSVLVGFGVSTFAMMNWALLRGVDEANNQALGGFIENLSVKNGRLRLSDTFGDELQEAKESQGITFVAAFGPTGKPLPLPGIQTLETGLGAFGPERECITLKGRSLRLMRRPINFKGHTLGTLLIAHTLESRNRILQSLFFTLLTAVPLAILATLLAGAWLSSKAIRPVKLAFEQQRRFIADASHELRTPVAIVQANAEIALEPAHPNTETLLEHLRAIQRTSVRMGRLVGDLLFLSRADAQALSPSFKCFYLDELGEELLLEFEPLAQAKGVSVALARAEGDYALLADPEQIRRLLVNLLDNALKFTPQGGSIRLTLHPEGTHRLQLDLTDSGPGIAPSALPHLFERFYRAEAARQQDVPGTGLGLAIAFEIAQAHSGTLSAFNAPNQGATFRLSLPRRI